MHLVHNYSLDLKQLCFEIFNGESVISFLIEFLQIFDKFSDLPDPSSLIIFPYAFILDFNF